MKKRHAFTLVELLVVIAIIAVLLAVLMPGLTTAKSFAKRLQCAKKLSGIGRGFNMYSEQYGGDLPSLENYMRNPTSTKTTPFTPSIESTYLLAKRTWNGGSLSGPYSFRHLGSLWGAGLVDNGQTFYCPAVEGWLGTLDDRGTNNGTYWGAISPNSGLFADLNFDWKQGPKARLGYCYWPLSKRYAKQVDLDGIDSSTALTRYNLGLPLSATKINDLMMTRPIVTDNKFHSTKISGWMVDCLYPDGHVTFQKQPRMEGLNGNNVQGTWGMYSDQENCQFTDDLTNPGPPVTIKDSQEKNNNLAVAITPTQFSFALEP